MAQGSNPNPSSTRIHPTIEMAQEFARYHVGQSLNLVTAEVLLALTVKILGWIPIFGLIVRILCSLAGVGLTVLMVFGIINAARGKAKALPLCGTIKNMMTEQ